LYDHVLGAKSVEKNGVRARRQWLMPIILATQEIEIRRIEV
jgi:hypothetical protein